MFSKTDKLSVQFPQEELQFLMECGYLCQDMGRAQQATDIFLGVTAICPDDPLPATAIATALLSSGQIDEAISHLGLVLNNFPDDPMATVHLGEAYVCKQDFGTATEYFEKVLLSDSEGPAGQIAKSYMDLIREIEKQ